MYPMEMGLKCANGRNCYPAQDNDRNGDSDFLQSVDNGRIEVESMCVIDSAGVLGIQDEREILHGHAVMKAVQNLRRT